VLRHFLLPGVIAVALAVSGLSSSTTVVSAAEGAAKAPADAKKNAQIRGFSIQLTDPKGIEGYIKAVDELADMGCTWINFVVAARQADKNSEKIRIIWQNIPSEKEIKRLLKHAKARGVSTMLMPIVLLEVAGPKDWRGVIAPADWDNWFASYTLYITYMADIAKACDVDLFCVGSELLSTETRKQQWDDVIAQVRQHFPGKLTYSANWDHYDTPQGGPTFWGSLDYIGMNNYNELADKPGATVAQLNKAWEPIKKNILTFVDKHKKPFFFTEVGWHNLENTINQPWNYVAEGRIDLNEQLRAYQSFVETWSTVPPEKCMGAFVWEWRPGAKATDHGTYSLQGSPALEVVKKWMQTR
jgi:hypothetical protein